MCQAIDEINAFHSIANEHAKANNYIIYICCIQPSASVIK